MQILVCVKAVPDRASAFRVNPERTGFDESGLIFGVNEYDLCAMEEAVRIQERFPGVEITAVSVGPARAEAALRKAMTLGAGQGVWIDDSAAPPTDALAVAGRIAAWARPRSFTLILCGVMSEDQERGQTGPMLAQLLGLPCATTVVSLRIAEDRKTLFCERELEAGVREQVELPLPALVTVQSGIALPRYASLSNVLRVKQLSIPMVPASSLGPIRSCERLVRAYPPERSGTCEFLEGELDRIAEQLLEKVRSRVPL